MREAFRRIGAMILALCLLVSMLSVAVLAEDGTDITGTIQFTVSGYSGVYDGEAHSISVNVTSPEGASVSYAYPTEGEYGSQNPAFTNAGEYKVAYMIAKESYATQTDIATVAIERADVSDAVESTLKSSFTYDGKSVKFAPFHEGIESWEMAYCDADGTSLSAAPSDPGSYSVKISGYGANYYAHVDHSFTIDDPEKEIEYSVEGFDVDYDGKPHSISLTVSTEGVTVSYATAYEGPYGETNPSFTEAGMYVVYYKLEKQGYKSEEGSVTSEIHAIDISDDVKATLPGSFTCTGAPVQFNLPTDKIQEWSVEYCQGDLSLESAPSTPGSYTATISGESGNYRASISHSFTIVEAEALPVIQYSVSGYSGYYDGQAHSIVLNIATEGVTATFASSEDSAYTATQPSFTEPGEYTIWFRLEKDGYETVVGSASVTIMELAQIDYTVQGFTGYYDGKAHTIVLNIATEGVTATFSTSEDGAYTTTQPSFTDPGEYTVWFRLEKEGYETVVGSASVTIMKLAQIDYTVQGYNGYYDGKAHTITLNVATEGATVTYATSGDGAYSAALPSFTDPGTYTVWFKIEKDAHTSVLDSETVTIKPGQIRYTVSDYNGVYDGEGHSITLSVLTPGAKVTYSVDDALALNAPPFSSDKPSFVDAGTFKVLYRIEKHGYETVKGSATVTIEKAEQKLYFEKSVNVLKLVDLDKLYAEFRFFCEQGAGVVTVSSSSGIIQALYQASDPSELSRYALYFSADVETPVTVTATAAETTNYKAATATCVFVRSYEIDASFDTTLNVRDAQFIGRNDGKEQTLKTEELGLTIRPVSDQDDKSLLGASLKLRKKLMDSVGASLIGSMAVDVALFDNQTGMEVHNVSGDLTLMLTGVLQQKYLENYKEMACYAVHLKQDSTTESTAAPTNTSTNGQSVYNDSSSFNMDGGNINTLGANAGGSGVYAGSSGFAMDGGNIDTATTGTSGSTAASQDTNGSNTTTGTSGSTAAPQDTNGSNTNAADNALKVNIGLGLNGTGNTSRVYESYLGLRNPASSDDNSSASSNEGQLLVQRGDLTLVPTGSLSPTVEFIPCKLTENGVIVSDTFLSPFLLIYGPKEAFSNLLTVRAKDGVFTYDGEGHAVAAEPSIVEGTTLYYSLDLESWQTEAPSFTDVLWNEDGSVGSYQVYVLAENPDCDPAVCSYTVTILPEA